MSRLGEESEEGRGLKAGSQISGFDESSQGIKSCKEWIQ